VALTFLPLPEPYDFELSTERYRAFGRDPANLWHEGGLHRVVGGREVRIEAAPGRVFVEPLDAGTRPVVEHLLGLPFDLDGFAAFARSEPVLAGLVERLRGLRPPLAPDPFESLVTSITAQQVSLFAAFAIRARFVERFGERAELAYAFPTRERLASAAEGELVALGFSRRKAEYVLALARSELDLHALAALPDEEVKAQIVAERGLGEWTADWFLARHLARPRAWPAGDLGLRKAVAHFYGRGRSTPAGRPVDSDGRAHEARALSVGVASDAEGEVDVRALGARLDPWQNLAAHYLLVGQRVPVTVSNGDMSA
jgi:3-methyladenine DNA glycosylase/8-oxoguanine DNA glycosylase